MDNMKSKRGVSVIIGYVLLITIAILLSVLVFNWLRFYVSPETKETCPEGVSLIIQDYSCANQKLNITLKNKGLFNISGFILRVHDRPGAKLGIHTLNKTGIPLAPGEEVTNEYAFADAELGGNPAGLTKITLIDVQPFLGNPGSEIYCERVSTQKVECLEGTTQPPGPEPGLSTPDSLISWWRFDESAGSTEAADSQDGNNISDLVMTSFTSGKIGNTLSVTSSSQLAQITSTPSNLKIPEDLSIEAWIKLNQIPSFGYAYIVGEFNGASPNYALKVETSGEIGFYWAGSSVVTSSVINIGEWYHIVGVKSGTDFTLYINYNEEVVSGTSSDSPSYDSDQLYIGRIGNGLTDEVTIYSKALFPTEIQQHYDNTKNGEKDYFGNVV